MGRREELPYLSQTRILLLLILGVLTPVGLMSAAGVVAIVVGGGIGSIVVGILVVSFALATLGAGTALLVIFQRRTRLAHQQVTFLTNVTHELRTPLAAIRLYGQTLQLERTEDPETRRQCVDAILRETGRLGQLVDRVLEWRRIAEGRRVYQKQRGRIDGAVDEALTNFQGLLAAGEVELRQERSATREAYIDQPALAEAVLNLLVNAHKYTGETKHIALHTRDVDGGVEIAVEDNGVGIPESEQARMFKPFRRGDDRLRSQASGVGIGLSIVRDVTRAHGGKVRVVSEPGRGSTFTIFLPAAPPADTGGKS
ncbi:MAG: HAMP domain-containing histidine kinase [Deltaproteobacteria bacterium]|nr:HAMP domain-containing histidine kinase [Deltaproteobacteria bacterium]